MRENRIGRKSKVSDGRSVRVGLVGPKPRPRGVGDGQRVNIPVPVACWRGTPGGGSATEWIVVASGGSPRCRAEMARSERYTGTRKDRTVNATARTANRHR